MRATKIRNNDDTYLFFKKVFEELLTKEKVPGQSSFLKLQTFHLGSDTYVFTIFSNLYTLKDAWLINNQLPSGNTVGSFKAVLSKFN
jgi:hypothetical protein